MACWTRDEGGELFAIWGFLLLALIDAAHRPSPKQPIEIVPTIDGEPIDEADRSTARGRTQTVSHGHAHHRRRERAYPLGDLHPAFWVQAGDGRPGWLPPLRSTAICRSAPMPAYDDDLNGYLFATLERRSQHWRHGPEAQFGHQQPAQPDPTRRMPADAWWLDRTRARRFVASHQRMQVAQRGDRPPERRISKPSSTISAAQARSPSSPISIDSGSPAITRARWPFALDQRKTVIRVHRSAGMVNGRSRLTMRASDCWPSIKRQRTFSHPPSGKRCGGAGASRSAARVACSSRTQGPMPFTSLSADGTLPRTALSWMQGAAPPSIPCRSTADRLLLIGDGELACRSRYRRGWPIWCWSTPPSLRPVHVLRFDGRTEPDAVRARTISIFWKHGTGYASLVHLPVAQRSETVARRAAHPHRAVSGRQAPIAD